MINSIQLVTDLFSEFRAQLPVEFQWEDEKARADELFFCVLSETLEIPIANARLLCSSLSNLNLFDIDLLAKADFNSRQDSEWIVSCLANIFRHNGVSDKAVETSLLTISEVARSIRDNYSGKPQHFLRKFGQAMVSELVSSCKLSRISEQQASRCFAHWLQNVLEMPVPLATNDLQRFASEKGLAVTDLVEAADYKDVNVAVLDDLVRCKYINEE